MSTNDEHAATVERKTNKGRRLKVTPTPRQRRAARIMADVAMGKAPHIKNQGDIVVAAGYAATVKEVPHKILETSGVHTALADIGFNPETAKKVVQKILESEEAMHKDRLKAADMVFKVHGTYAAEKHVSLNVDATVDDTRLLELAARLRNSA